VGIVLEDLKLRYFDQRAQGSTGEVMPMMSRIKALKRSMEAKF